MEGDSKAIMSNFTGLEVPATSLTAMGFKKTDTVRGFQFDLVFPWTNKTIARGWFDSGTKSVTTFDTTDSGTYSVEMFWAHPRVSLNTKQSSVAVGVSQVPRILAQKVHQHLIRRPISHAHGLNLLEHRVTDPCAEKWSQQGLQNPFWWEFVWDFTSSLADRFNGYLKVQSNSTTCEISMQLIDSIQTVQTRTVTFTNFQPLQIPGDTFAAVSGPTPDPSESFAASLHDSWRKTQIGKVIGFTYPFADAPGYLYFVFPNGEREIIYLTVAN
jgi:hypothetical protein